MSAHGPKTSKPAREASQLSNSKSSSSSSSLSSHLAMVELKQRIITGLTKLADRDTHQIALEELHSIIEALPPESLPMLLNSLYESLSDQSNFKPTVKKDSLLLLSFTCESHKEATAPHLARIISYIVKRLKDPDSNVRDACKDAIGSLSGLYLRNSSGGDTNMSNEVGLFVKPLFEAMAEQNKIVQSGAAMCLAKVVECASISDGKGVFPIAAFQKLCPRICKLLSGQNFLAKASLLGAVTSLSQAGAVTQNCVDSLLQGVIHCLNSSDWATRKASAEVLSALALHSSSFVTEEAINSTIASLEACRFDKIKPARDSMSEALQSWKQLAERKEGNHSEQKELETNPKPDDPKVENPVRVSSSDAALESAADSKPKTGGIPEKAVVILKKKAPALSDKELNPEFFQKLETRGSDDLPVEVVVPRRFTPQSARGNDAESEIKTSKMSRIHPNLDLVDANSPGKNKEADQRGFSKHENHHEGSLVSSKGNLLAIQRQLLQLERQQANIMGMLQDFMGGSHESMVTLENRVRGLERVVEDMARDLSSSSSRRSGSYSMNSLKFSAFPDFNPKYNGRSSSFTDRYSQSDLNFRGRNTHWRPDNSANGSDHMPNRRGWDKGTGPVRLGEGPSARSVWQASKDEATLEAIRVVGEDGGVARTGRVAMPESEMVGSERDSNPNPNPVWNTWRNAMDAVKAGDFDTAYVEVLSAGEDGLLVKLMEMTGPVFDQLMNETACDVLYALGQFLPDQSLSELALTWVHQLVEIVESSADVMRVPIELKKEILLSLNDASALEIPEDWEGQFPEQLLVQLATLWEIEVQQFDK